jgi:hypothetical protein
MVGDEPIRVVQRRVRVTNSQAGNRALPSYPPITRKRHNQVPPPWYTHRTSS